MQSDAVDSPSKCAPRSNSKSRRTHAKRGGSEAALSHMKTITQFRSSAFLFQVSRKIPAKGGSEAALSHMETAYPALETRRICEEYHRGAMQKSKMTAASTAAILRQFPKFQKKVSPEIPEEILPPEENLSRNPRGNPSENLPLLGDKQDDIASEPAH